MSEGWIKSHRKISYEWEWSASPREYCLFSHILHRVNHKEARWQGIDIAPGQMVTSINSLMKITGLTKQQVRTGLRNLSSTQELTLKKTTKYTVITVSRWSDYQQLNTASNTQLTHGQHTANTRPTLNKNKKNEKNEKNEKKTNDQFESLYKLYPRKIGKQKGASIYEKTITSEEDSSLLLKAIKNYVIQIERDGTEAKYIKHFPTFMGCWRDYLEIDTALPVRIMDKGSSAQAKQNRMLKMLDEVGNEQLS